MERDVDVGDDTAGLSGAERRLLTGIVREVGPDLRRHLSELDAVEAFQGAQERLVPGRDLIDGTALPFAFPLVLALIVLDIPVWLHCLLLVPLIALCVFAARRLFAFRREVRQDLERVAERNRAGRAGWAD